MKDKDKEKKNKTALEAAYDHISPRMRTSAEVRKHLEGMEYPEEEISEAIEELTGLSYLDDYLYALRYYERNREKRRGVLRAERELIEKGVDRETARNAKEDFLHEQNVDEFEDAMEIARKEVVAHPGIHAEAARAGEAVDRLAAKIARKLEGKGYSKSDIFRVLDRIRRESRDADGPSGW